MVWVLFSSKKKKQKNKQKVEAFCQTSVEMRFARLQDERTKDFWTTGLGWLAN